MEKLLKAFFIIVIVLGLVILLNHNLQMRERGVCIKQQKMVMEQEKNGMRVAALLVRPQCAWDGNYLVQQCDYFTQTCWCVDKLGRPVKATQTPRTHGQPQACSLSWFEQAFLVWQLRAQRDGFVPLKNSAESPKTPSKVNNS